METLNLSKPNTNEQEILLRKIETRKNKFGNTYSYSLHILPESEKQKAIELYNKLNKN